MEEYYLPKFAIYDRDFRHQSVLFGGSSHWPFKGQSRSLYLAFSSSWNFLSLFSSFSLTSILWEWNFFYREFYFTFITSYCEIRKKEETRKNSGIYLFLCVKSMNIHIGCFTNGRQFKLSKILRAIHWVKRRGNKICLFEVRVDSWIWIIRII